MLNRTVPLLLASCLTSTVWAANDPLAGKWMVDSSKSKLNDEMKVEDAGANRYAITFGPGQVDTVVADGSDQPALSGTTLSISNKGLNGWEVVRKMKGRMLLKAQWTLSEDGKILNDAFTQYLPDGMTLFSQPLPNGSTLFLPYSYERTAGSSGFVGTWDSESAKVRAGIELQVTPYEGDGISFKRSDEPTAKKFKLDGNDHPGPDLDAGNEGTSHSARRVDTRSVEVTDKFKGKITGDLRFEVSQDLKTLTITERLAGQNRPKSALVFNRE
jgi:hypothetical protein